MNRQSKKITAIYTLIDKGGNPATAKTILAHQQEELTRYAREKGVDNIQIFSDCGYNGIDDFRPDFQKLLTAIRRGKVSTLVVRDTGRLYRVSVKITELVEEILSRHHVDLYAVTEGISPETPAPRIYTALASMMGGTR